MSWVDNVSSPMKYDLNESFDLTRSITHTSSVDFFPDDFSFQYFSTINIWFHIGEIDLVPLKRESFLFPSQSSQ